MTVRELSRLTRLADEIEQAEKDRKLAEEYPEMNAEESSEEWE